MNKLCIACLMTLCFACGISYAYDEYYLPSEDNKILEFNVYNEGEIFIEPYTGLPVAISEFNLSQEYLRPIINATNELLKAIHIDTPPSSEPIKLAIITQEMHNAYSATLYRTNVGAYQMPAFQAILQNKDYNIGAVPSYIAIGRGLINDNWGLMNGYYPLYKGNDAYLYSVMTHEILHSLGFLSGSKPFESRGGGYYFSESATDPIMLWDSFLRIYKEGGEITPERGMGIRYSADSEGEFDVYSYSPYFAGTNTLKALTGTTDKSDEEMKQILHENGGLKNYAHYEQYSSSDVLPKVYGLPVNPNNLAQTSADLSHTELRNSFMSHQNYRNWTTPMEAEYGALKDLGYNVEPREYFGKSYYLNNVTDNFSTGYSEWNSQTQQYTGNPSTVRNGTGLHIYGDNNNITQTSDILSIGEGTIGARIEGINNNYTLQSGNYINTSGARSIGLATTWGKGHTININNGSTIRAEGNEGIGISLNLGSNMLGDYLISKGSYSYSKYISGETYQIVPPDTELQGALVDNLNISGTVIGKQAAIYISDNAHVNNINILNGSNIQGDIISDWNSKSSGDYSKVYYNNGGSWVLSDPDAGTGHFTNLNFGSDTDTYEGTFSSNISGDNGIYNTLKMNVKDNSNLTLDGSNIAVYELKNTGTINVDNSVSISTQKSDNSIYGGGEINIKTNGTMTLQDSVKSVYNTVRVQEKGTISTANNVAGTHTIDKLVTAPKAKLSFDIGDVLTINDTTGSEGQAKYSSIKISDEELANLEAQGLAYEKTLYSNGSKTVDMGTNMFNIYSNGIKYIFAQDGTSPAKIKVVSLREVSEGINEAATDPTTGNYIVPNGEIQPLDGGIVAGDEFEVTGADLNFGGHRGLIVDGTSNEDGTTIKVSTYNATADDDYKGTYTVRNSGSLIVETNNKNIKISPTTNSDSYPANAIYIDSTSNAKLNALNNNIITIDGKIQGENGAKLTTMGNAVNLRDLSRMLVSQNANKTTLMGTSTDTAFELNQGMLFAQKDSYLSSNGTNSLVLNGGTLNLQNNEANKIDLASMKLNNNTNVLVDMDLKNRSIDRFSFNSADDLDTEDVILNLASINMVNSATKDIDKAQIKFIDPSLNNTALLGKVTSSISQVTTPIYKYNTTYTEDDTSGTFTFSLPAGRNDYRSFNPAVMATPVSTQAGGYLTQLVSYDMAFSNMDMLMNLPADARKAALLRNRYAVAEDTLMRYNPNQLPELDKGIWFKPYTSFDNVELQGGVKVDNIGYGAFIGGDSNAQQLKRGWNGVFSGYIGYNGAHQTYDGVGAYQNGVQGGLSGILYRKHFFTGLTANIGGSLISANTMYGHDNYGMFTSGVAMKTGYNFETEKGGFIFQPSYMMSYSFIDAQDYTNSAGIRIVSDPLNTIQIVPGVKFIFNTKSGWQPYISTQMYWNILNKSKVFANEVELPTLSVRPYIQYGAGVQKSIGEIFTCYGQTMIRNIGRNGVSLSFGMKWAVR